MPENQLEKQGERLKKIRKHWNLMQEELAPKLGITQSHLSALERGRYDLTTDLMLKLLEFDENLNLNWLIAGKGEMHIIRLTADPKEGYTPAEDPDRLAKIEAFLKEKFGDFKGL